ncbi:MAG TPA: hypothetical protein P5162_08290 [Bacteroidia bacterium]|nr:hypothetical protein [Bacteroidia bacterium]
MNKIILSITGVLFSLCTMAQGNSDSLSAQLQHSMNREMSQSADKQIVAPVLIVGLLIFLILSLIRYFLDYRLKNKIVSKGISEQLSATILEKNSKNKIDEAIKWAILLCGVATGLTITYYTMPLNIHSLAIMAFCIGASYFAYFTYLKNQKK